MNNKLLNEFDVYWAFKKNRTQNKQINKYSNEHSITNNYLHEVTI